MEQFWSYRKLHHLCLQLDKLGGSHDGQLGMHHVCYFRCSSVKVSRSKKVLTKIGMLNFYFSEKSPFDSITSVWMCGCWGSSEMLSCLHQQFRLSPQVFSVVPSSYMCLNVRSVVMCVPSSMVSQESQWWQPLLSYPVIGSPQTRGPQPPPSTRPPTCWAMVSPCWLVLPWSMCLLTALQTTAAVQPKMK